MAEYTITNDFCIKKQCRNLHIQSKIQCASFQYNPLVLAVTLIIIKVFSIYLQ